MGTATYFVFTQAGGLQVPGNVTVSAGDISATHSVPGGSALLQITNPGTTNASASMLQLVTGTPNSYGYMRVVENGSGASQLQLGVGPAVTQGVVIAAPTTVSSLTLSGNTSPTITQSTVWTNYNSADSNGQTGCISIGNSANPFCFYRNNEHDFQSRDQSVTYARFSAGGTFNVSGSWGVLSDASLKQDVVPYERGLAAIQALEPVQFRYAAGTPFASGGDPSKLLVGLIASDVQPYVPEMVGSTTVRLAGDDGAGTVVDTLSPGDLTYVLINAVKEMAARLASAEATIAALQGGAQP